MRFLRSAPLVACAVLGIGCPDSSEPDAPKEQTADARVGDASDWCAEHALPESMCTKCNEELASEFKDRGDWCGEHGFPESVCPLCHPMQPPPGMASAQREGPSLEPGTRIRFKSPRIERAAGIQTVTARRAVLGEGVQCTARIEFDQDLVADIRAPVQGIVRGVRVELGAEVARGDPLFVLESPRVGELQAERRARGERVRNARAHYERVRGLERKGSASTRRLERARDELESAQAQAQAARSALRMTGGVGGGDGRFVLRAPMGGTVVRRPATVGSFATAETSLATVADTSTMWAILDVREGRVAAVEPGQQVTVFVDGLEGRSFSGTVDWVAPQVDARTRTVRVRAELANDEGLLRAHQFGRAVVQVDEGARAVSVPRESVQRMGEQSVVFVRTGEGIYEPRSVRLGRSEKQLVQVWGPVEAGDAVATAGAFLLKTELQRGSIGAGCCEVEPPSGG
jgi:cobalt-zinc-cadmium efflux system membrane fusion protein